MSGNCEITIFAVAALPHSEIARGIGGGSFKAARKRRRRREQLQCKHFWALVYGSDAERRSRGGVAWL